MAMSTCIKCGSTMFEVKEVSPHGSGYKFTFIQCALCGGVIGAMDYYNIGNMLIQLGKKVGIDLS